MGYCNMVANCSSLLISGVARAQPMPGHSMGTMFAYPGPAQLLHLQYGNTEATRGSGGRFPRGIFELPRSILRLL